MGDEQALINFSFMHRTQAQKLPACNYAGILAGPSSPQDSHLLTLLTIEKTLDTPGVGNFSFLYFKLALATACS